MTLIYKIVSVCTRNRVHYLSQKCFATQVVSPLTMPKPHMDHQQSLNPATHQPSQHAEESPPSILNRRSPGETIEALRKEFSTIGEGKFDLFKDEQSGVAIITIDQPQRRNALSGRMMAQFNDVISELESWKQGKAVIIQGKGGFFCSGGDLTTVKCIETHEGGRQMGLVMQDNLNRLQKLPMITVALIEGKAIGGGAEITTACDFRLMTPNAEIGFVHIKLAITVSWGAGSRLVQLLGPAKALQLMASGERLNAQDALGCGLINGILDNAIEQDPDDVLSKARLWLEPYIKGHTETLRAVKAIVEGARRLPLDEALNQELQISSTTWGSKAHKQANSRNIKHK